MAPAGPAGQGRRPFRGKRMQSTTRKEPNETAIRTDGALPATISRIHQGERMKFIVRFILLAAFFTVMNEPANLRATIEPVVPVKDTVTMVDLGAKSCIPCKMMAPILEELKDEYQGRAEVIFIDVWEDRSQGPRFGIRSIPTQIFYDKQGKEAYRHVGFMGKEQIKKLLDMLLEGK